jgi:hypothetical protein
VFRKFLNIGFIFPLILIAVAECASHEMENRSSPIRAKTDLEQVLTWLPGDTETLLVANGPLFLSNFEIGHEVYPNHQVTREELEEDFEGMTLQLFNSKNGLLEKHLRGKKVLFAIEASRHFRPPAGLGELPFEGCAVAVF